MFIKIKAMRVLLRPALFALLLVIAGSFKNIEQRSVIIKGKVIEEGTGQPVAKAHVFVIEGEEETLTNSDGEFQIESWQKAPLRLTVSSYKRYVKTTVLVQNAGEKQLIRLKTK